MCTDNAAMVAAAGWWKLQAEGPSPMDTGAVPGLKLDFVRRPRSESAIDVRAGSRTRRSTAATWYADSTWDDDNKVQAGIEGTSEAARPAHRPMSSGRAAAAVGHHARSRCAGCCTWPRPRRRTSRARRPTCSEEIDARRIAPEAEHLLLESLRDVWSRGWQPAEVHREARRSGTVAQARLVVVLVDAERAEHPPAGLDPRWAAQRPAVST